jgi:hypothetical protein
MTVIYTAILVCEVAFWVFVGAGLAARYLVGRPRLGLVLLLGSPLTDLALLTLTAMHLHTGAAPTQAHALAAAYLGITLAFGHSLVRWADRHAAHRLGSGPVPPKAVRIGRDKVRYEWREFGKAGVAWLVSCLILAGLAGVAGGIDESEVLVGNAGMFTVILGIWFATGPAPATIGAARWRNG